MRTAHATVILTDGARPKAAATLNAASSALEHTIAAGLHRIGPIRFTGYAPTLQAAGVTTPYDIPQGARIACYEADYPDYPDAHAVVEQ